MDFCLDCNAEIDLSRGCCTVCPECGAKHYVCYQCEDVELYTMHCDDEIGYICDSCIDDNDDFFSDEHEM